MSQICQCRSDQMLRIPITWQRFNMFTQCHVPVHTFFMIVGHILHVVSIMDTVLCDRIIRQLFGTHTLGLRLSNIFSYITVSEEHMVRYRVIHKF